MEKQLAEITARMRKINEAQAEIERDANLNTEGVFTDDQTKSYEALDDQFKQLEDQKNALEKQMELVANRAAREDLLKPRILSRPRSGANAGSQMTAIRPNGLPIEADNETGDREVHFTIPAKVKRIRPQNFHGVKDGLDGEHRAYRFGMWALSTLAYCMPRYGNSFAHAQEFVKNYMDPRNVAHGENDATTGGHFLVPEEFSRDLIDLRERYGVARRLFSRAPMTSDVLNIPKRSSGLTASFTAESAAAAESNMSWDNLQLVAKKMTALSRMSNELSADAVISVGDQLAGEMSYAFANKEDECAFNGDGTSTYGAINGVRNLLTDCDGAGTDSTGLVDSTTSNTWVAIVLGDFNNVVAKLPQYADTQNACWVCHRAFYYGVMQKLEMAAGGAQMMEVAQGDRRPRPLFMGYPVEFSQVFPSATATSLVSCVLGDFSLGALFGDRQTAAISFSEHATIGGENVFERGQIAIRGEERFDIKVHGCGTASVVGPIVGLTTGA
jgi:HK97 family phage major capsid protein